LRRQCTNHPVATVFAAGSLNALLPCGLVYVALSAAVATGHAARGASVMLMFGIGTVPALSALLGVAAAVPVTWRRALRVLQPVAFLFIGLLLIDRGVRTSAMAAHVGAAVPAGHAPHAMMSMPHLETEGTR
jgi:sulfite exporter TauE/SafE